MEISKRVNQYYGSIPKNNFVCSQPKFKFEKFTIPEAIMDASYGCANPLPRGVHHGMSITDLGCGAGRDACYMGILGASRVIGVDASTQLLEIATEHAQPFIENLSHNPKALFIHGELDNLSFILQKNLSINEDTENTPSSHESWKQDLFISNCVISLCPVKSLVIEEVWKSLKTGGEFYFSDMYCSRKVEKEFMEDDELLNYGISNSFYWRDFVTTCQKTGFLDIRVKDCDKMKTIPPDVQAKIGEKSHFYSITFRLFKGDNFEPTRENYGDQAVYLGGIRGEENKYNFDVNYTFEKGVSQSIDGNLAKILKNGWLNEYFTVISGNDSHIGPHSSGTIENDLMSVISPISYK